MSAVPQPMDEPLVLRQDAGGVTTLTLNRPAQFNALSQAMLSALQESLDAIAADPVVRVVVLAGAGKAFCAGHDLKEMRGTPSKEFQQALFRQRYVCLASADHPRIRGGLTREQFEQLKRDLGK